MSFDFLHTTFEKAGYLANLISTYATGTNIKPNDYKLLRNELLAIPEIQHLIPSFVRLCPDISILWTSFIKKYATYQERRNVISEQFTPLLDFLEKKQSPAIAAPASSSAPASVLSSASENWTVAFQSALPAPVLRNKRKVFIVHGRDDAAKQEVARWISSLGLEPIILHEQASSGMTIIEKIERYTNDADFALVLYTPCDLGKVAADTTELSKRARQNVVFEHGYLMAKLGRKNVCALVKDIVETPNDISGVVYIKLDSYGGWKAEVSKELSACGYVLKNEI